MKTKTNDRARTYGFRVTTEAWCDKPCVVLRVLAREGDSASPINPRTDGENTIWDAPKRLDGMMLAGLTIRFYGSDYKDWAVSYRSAEFENVGFCDAACAKAILKTYACIDRALKRAPIENGAAEVFIGHVAAVATAIGASWYAKELTQGGWNYASSTWEFKSLVHLWAELRRQWDKLEAEHAAKFPPELPLEPKRTPDTPDYVVFDDDPEGLSSHKRAQYDVDGKPYPERVLEACAYQKGNSMPIRSLGDIDFYEDGGDWMKGRFSRVNEIPECCPHLREIAKDMGLPE